MATNPQAELSALASTLDDLTARVAALAKTLDREPTDRAATDLFEVERSLRAATRRMERARRELP